MLLITVLNKENISLIKKNAQLLVEFDQYLHNDNSIFHVHKVFDDDNSDEEWTPDSITRLG